MTGDRVYLGGASLGLFDIVPVGLVDVRFVQMKVRGESLSS